MRRVFLGLVITALVRAGKDSIQLLPVDPEKLNRFANAFNSYLIALKEGRADLKLWKAVVDAWGSL